MTRRGGNSGFTFVESLTALLLITALVTIAWSRYRRWYEKAPVATMISDLRNTATAQKLYHRLHLTYAHDIDLLEISPSPKREINVDQATARGWAGWAQIERILERCEITVCLWAGCVPSKALIRTAQLLHDARYRGFVTLTASRRGRLLGGHMLGHAADALVHEIAPSPCALR